MWKIESIGTPSSGDEIWISQFHPFLWVFLQLFLSQDMQAFYLLGLEYV